MKVKKNGLYYILTILSVLASLKMIFFAFGLDEEYQVVMAYRNARGDRLFLDMWEPHQSSAFLCAFLMKPYLALFGTTGVVLYLRVCGTLLHLGVSCYLYRVIKDFLDVKYAWLLALIYYNTIPKQIILPEFGIMQVWFYTLMSLFLVQFYKQCPPSANRTPKTGQNNGKKMRYLILAALALTLNILSYPSCLILFPFLLILIAVFSGQNRWRDMGIATLTCGLCGLGYLGLLFTYTNPGELLETLSHILAGDVTHSLTVGGKLLSLLRDSIYMAGLWVSCLLPAFIITKWKKLSRVQFCCLTAGFSCLLEIFYWVVLGTGYELMHIHLVAFTLSGLCVGRAQGKRLLHYIMAGAVLSLLAVTYLTDLSFAESIPHAMPAAFCGAILLVATSHGTCRTGAFVPASCDISSEGKFCDTSNAGQETVSTPKDNNSEKNRKWVYALLSMWCLTAIFGKGYTLRSGTNYRNVLQSGGILRHGPAAGTISNYIGAYIYNCDYEDWQAYIQDGDKVLIMVDQVMNLGTIQYLFKDVEISHFSIVNPTAYDERLLEYWELHPEKYPNVIIVDCWYGQLMTDPDGWLMQYIENNFGYTQMIDGKYIRIYRRDADGS